MLLASTFLLLALEAQPARPAVPHQVNVWKPLALYSTLAAGDLLSTEYALRKNPNARELHPLGQTSGQRIGLKLAEVAVKTLPDMWFQDHKPRWVKPWRIGWAILSALVMAWNVSQS